MELGTVELPASVIARVVVALLWAAPMVALGAAIWQFRQRSTPRRGGWPASWMLPFLAAVQLGAVAVAVVQLGVARNTAHQSAFAKVDLSVFGQVEWIVVLGGWVPLALGAGYAALLLLWAALQRRVGLAHAAGASDAHVAEAWRQQPGPSLPWVLASAAVCCVGLWQVRARVIDFLSLPPHQRMPADLERHFDVTSRALGHAALELFVALLLAALALVASVVLTTGKRSRLAERDLAGSAPTPRTTVLVVLVCAAVVVAFETRTGPLKLESESPIPMTHSFANASLGFLPPVGLQGIGSDPVPEGTLVVLGPSSASVDGVAAGDTAELGNILRNKRDLFIQLNPKASPRSHVLVTVAADVDAERLRSYLAAFRSAGMHTAYFTLSDVQILQRPVLGELVGVRLTGTRVALVTDAEACPESQLVEPNDREALRSLPAILLELVVPNHVPPCHVVASR